jgi:hypothetical protein
LAFKKIISANQRHYTENQQGKKTVKPQKRTIYFLLNPKLLLATQICFHIIFLKIWQFKGKNRENIDNALF